jgi:iron complex transport system ATP-binding protein
VQAPRIILADEALSRMDLNHQAETGRVLREFASENRAVILVSHDLNIATEWADSALLLRDGKSLARGPLKEVLTDQRVRELYPHSSLKVASSPVSGTPKIFFGAPQR